MTTFLLLLLGLAVGYAIVITIGYFAAMDQSDEHATRHRQALDTIAALRHDLQATDDALHAQKAIIEAQRLRADTALELARAWQFAREAAAGAQQARTVLGVVADTDA